MTKQKRKGPSCMGSLLLMVLIVIGLKIAYSRLPSHTAENIGSGETDTADTETESLYDILYRELKAYAKTITFDYDCSAELFDTYKRVCDDHPELFWVNGSGKSEKRTIGTEVTLTLIPDIPITLVEILEYRQELDEKKNEILAGIDPAWNRYDKILYIHDYLVENTEYDSDCAARIGEDTEFSEYWQSSSAYGCLVQGKAICSGYAAAFQLLLKELDIPCIRVSGHEIESGVAHEWNCVRMGEKWYYVDVTWDDPVYMEENTYFTQDISYEYCMITEEMLVRTHRISEKSSVPICDDPSFYYYRYYGKYLESYTYAETAAQITAQMGNDIIELCFPDRETAQLAAKALFDEKRIYDIAAVQDAQREYVTYSVGKNGLLRIAFSDQSTKKISIHNPV